MVALGHRTPKSLLLTALLSYKGRRKAEREKGERDRRKKGKEERQEWWETERVVRERGGGEAERLKKLQDRKKVK